MNRDVISNIMRYCKIRYIEMSCPYPEFGGKYVEISYPVEKFLDTEH